jgi:Tfp pilus assembly protein PilV
MPLASIRGFTLVEALIALAVITTGLLALATVALQMTDRVAHSRRHLLSAWLADEGVALHSRRPLSATPADCLQRDVAGCLETLDGHGRPTAAAPALVRRWRVARVATAPTPAWTVAVCVLPADRRTSAAAGPAGACVARVVHEVWP